MKRLPAEFEEQSFVQLIFPHPQSDWAPYLEEARHCFVDIARAIARYEPCLIVCDDVELVKSYFNDRSNLLFLPYQSDDTWARDCSGITVYDDGKPLIYDFTFNGWGGKFDATRDNAMTGALAKHCSTPVEPVDFILEGGGIESNGSGVLLSTAECLLNPNRNPGLTKEEIEAKLTEWFGLEKILWLHHGYLSGDDTDSHIDTLARFVARDTIMYVQCTDNEDEHYELLRKMEEELRALRDQHGKTFKLILLPMCAAFYYEGERLPATYANFLLINGAVLLPVYNIPQDAEAVSVFEKTFPYRDIIPIDCSVLIRQHGSLHCVTMQFPKGTKPPVL